MKEGGLNVLVWCNLALEWKEKQGSKQVIKNKREEQQRTNSKQHSPKINSTKAEKSTKERKGQRRWEVERDKLWSSSARKEELTKSQKMTWFFKLFKEEKKGFPSFEMNSQAFSIKICTWYQERKWLFRSQRWICRNEYDELTWGEKEGIIVLKVWKYLIIKGLSYQTAIKLFCMDCSRRITNKFHEKTIFEKLSFCMTNPRRN